MVLKQVLEVDIWDGLIFEKKAVTQSYAKNTQSFTEKY